MIEYSQSKQNVGSGIIVVSGPTAPAGPDADVGVCRGSTACLSSVAFIAGRSQPEGLPSSDPRREGCYVYEKVDKERERTRLPIL